MVCDQFMFNHYMVICDGQSHKNYSSFSDTSFMMSYHEQMKGNEKIQSRPESGRDTPFDQNHLKEVDINVNWVLKERCKNI